MGDSSAPIIARVVVAPLPSASTRERAMTRANLARKSSSSSSSSASSSSSSSEDDEDEDVRSRHTGGGALFDDDSDSDRRDDRDDGDETKSDDDDDGLTINRAFAKRFEHNERRKEMHRLQAKLEREYATRALAPRDGTSGSGSEGESASDSSETESDEEETLERAFDGAFAEALTKIRSRDPSLYDEETKLFDDETTEEEEEETKEKTKEKKKKATLREVTARQLLEGGATALEDAEAEAEAMKTRDDAPSYVEEQAALKRAFKDAAFGNDGGESGSESESDESDDDGGLVVKSRAEDASAATEKLSEFFGDEEKLSAEDKFLRQYVLEKQLMKDDTKSVAARMKTLGRNDDDDESGSDDDAKGSDGDDESSDSELLERTEAFEHNYNFRFEEPGADKLVSHSRHIEGLVRREDTKRRDKRKQVRERKESERAKLLAEIRRLKNLKREEIDNKMRQISAVGGLSSKASASSLKVTNLTEEFDPEAHDRAMREMYGEEYYEDDGELGAKPEFGDLEDEVKEMLAAEGADEEEGEEEEEELGADDDDDDDDDDDIDDNNENDVEENKFSKRAAKKWRKQLEAKMDEYYKLDAEDFIGDVPTRFAYTELAPKMFGLTTRDILQMDDKSLNQIVGLKKLAPYREDADDAAVSANQRARARRMAKEFYAKSSDKKKTKGNRKGTKKKRDDDDDVGDDEDEDDAAEARAKSYADAAFGKKKSKSSSSKRAKKSHGDDDDDEKPLEPRRAVGKNAKKNAKKRAKRKAAAAETATLDS